MTTLYWLEGSWPGRLAIAARPRGGDWLEDEIINWQRSGIDEILSLLTPEEEEELGLSFESVTAKKRGVAFNSLPIPDRAVPLSETQADQILRRIQADLNSGKNVVIHCRQGVGRSSLVAALLLNREGMDPETALRKISSVRGVPVPETEEQRRWIEQHAITLA